MGRDVCLLGRLRRPIQELGQGQMFLCAGEQMGRALPRRSQRPSKQRLVRERPGRVQRPIELPHTLFKSRLVSWCSFSRRDRRYLLHQILCHCIQDTWQRQIHRYRRMRDSCTSHWLLRTQTKVNRSPPVLRATWTSGPGILSILIATAIIVPRMTAICQQARRWRTRGCIMRVHWGNGHTDFVC